MVSKKDIVLPLAAGALVGGSLVFILNNVSQILPQIKIFNASGQQTGTIPAGQAYSLYFLGFPANTPLVSARNTTVAGGDLVTLGTTGADGILTISGLTAVGSGTFYIYAHDAPTGKYCAIATMLVT